MDEGSDRSESSYDGSSASQSSSHDSKLSDYVVARSTQVNAYDDEPLAQPGVVVETEEMDVDKLTPFTLEMRSDKRTPLTEWCMCHCCNDTLLVGILEYRCCREIMPVEGMLAQLNLGKEKSLEIQCITQHPDFLPMVNPTVLDQVGPLFRDKDGHSYRRTSGQNRNEYLRAVAYRWMIRWICGILGWGNTRPLSSCIYHKITELYPTQEKRGYISAQQRQ